MIKGTIKDYTITTLEDLIEKAIPLTCINTYLSTITHQRT